MMSDLRFEIRDPKIRDQKLIKVWSARPQKLQEHGTKKI